MPERLRVLGFADTTLLWLNFGVSLLVLVLPAYFDLSLKKALAATLVGALIGNSMLALAALIGADARVPTMVLQRAPLGQRGSYIATVLNVAQCLGWAIFELIVIATAAGLLCDQLFGFEAVWAWKLLFGGLAAALALMGPIGFVRRFVRKFAIWAVAASVAYLAWWILDGADLGALWSQPGEHHGSFWLAVDTVVAVTVSWAPLVADYTRFSRDRRSAFFGVGLGYLLPTLFQFGFGSILVLSRGVDPNHPELILTAIAGGGAAAALALLALTVDETDEAFANVYSGAISTQNLLSRVPQRALIASAAVDRDARRPRDRHAQLPAVPAPPGRSLRPAAGRPGSALAVLGRALHRAGRLRKPGLPARPDRRLGGRLPALRVALPAGRPRLLERPDREAPAPGYQIGASLPSFALAFVLTGLLQTLSSPRATMTAEPPTSTR